MPGGILCWQVEIGFLGPVGREIGDVFFDAHFRGFGSKDAGWEG